MKLFVRLKALAGRHGPRSTFARGVGVLVGGTAGAQVLTILAAPMLTRLYTPEQFGLLAVYASLLGLVAVIASLRYELAIPLPEDDDEAAQLVALSGLLVLGTAFVTALLVLLIAQPIARWLGSPQLAPYLWLLPLGVLMIGSYSLFRYWALRTKAYSVVAGTTVRQSLATLLIQIAGYKLGAISLLAGQAIGHGAGTVRLGLYFFRSKQRKSLRWSRMWKQAVRYKRFPIYSSWEGLFNTAGAQLPPLLLALLFSPAAAGLYSLANRTLSLPVTLIGTSVGQVFFSNAAEAYRGGRLGSLVAQLHTRLVHLGMPSAFLFMLIGPSLFAWVFGPDWRQAGDFARWMTPWLYLVFVSSPLSVLFAVTEQQKEGLTFQAILLLVRIVTLLGGAFIGDLLLTIVLFSAASAICWLGFLVWIGISTGNTIYIMLRPMSSALIVSVACSVPVMTVYFFSAGSSEFRNFGFILSAALVSLRAAFVLSKFSTPTNENVA